MFLKTDGCSASVALAISLLSLTFSGLFGTIYVNESQLFIIRSKQMLIFNFYLRIQLFEFHFNCKKGLLYTAMSQTNPKVQEW